MKVISPLGEYPFVFDRVERRDGAVELVGSVVGLESRLRLEREDLLSAARRLGPPLLAALGLAAALGYASARRR